MLQRMLLAASNPDAENPDVVVRTLPAEKQAAIAETVRGVRDTTRGVIQRGAAGLLAVSDAEWNRLVDGAN